MTLQPKYPWKAGSEKNSKLITRLNTGWKWLNFSNGSILSFWFEGKNWLYSRVLTLQNVVTRPMPSSSASSSHTGRSVNRTRNMATVTMAFLHVPTSVTSFRHGFSGVLWKTYSWSWNQKRIWKHEKHIIHPYLILPIWVPGILSHIVPKEGIKAHQAGSRKKNKISWEYKSPVQWFKKQTYLKH